MEGLIIRTGSTEFEIRTPDGATHKGVVKGSFRLLGIRSTNPLTVGDRVEFDPRTGYITRLMPRKNYIVRRPTNLSRQLHILAANVDRAMLVVTLREPETDLGFVDRFLVTAEAYRVPVTLLFNKTDLLGPEDLNLLRAIEYLYQSIGYPTLRIAAADPACNLEPLSQMLQGRTTLISGNSGVGKSTLINRLIPGAETRVGHISDAHHKGMHTTTFSQMYEYLGGYIIDTPGIKGFGVVDMQAREISHYFPEIFREAHNCRFDDCTHTHEPGCAVRKAVEEHRIAQSRYHNYLAILDDLTKGKYRQ